MVTLAEAAEELLALKRGRSNLLDYITYTNPKFRVSAFSESVCAALDQFIDDVNAGKRPILILQAPPQHGKLCADDTPVLTANGWKTHGELRVGSRVYSPDGTLVTVTAISPKASANCKITFTDGLIVYCHENHEWFVRSRDVKREVILSAKEMMQIGRRTLRSNPLLFGVYGKRGSRYNYQLPFVQPLAGEICNLPVGPYSFGAWLGDGTRTSPNITGDIKDVEVLNAIVEEGYPIRSQWVHRQTRVVTTSFSNLWKDLKRAEVTSKAHGWKPKFIPDIYYNAPLADRLQLLAGLIDTDGYVYPKNGRTCFTTSDFELSQSFVKLLATFGWRATVVREEPKMSSSGIQGKKPYWVISFNPTMSIPCRLARKRTSIFAKQRRIAIRSIEFGEWGKIGHCVQVDREDGMYLVGDTLIPTHNSEMVSRKLPAYLLGRMPDLRIGAASYSSGLANALAQDVRRNIASPEHCRLFPNAVDRGRFDVSRMGEFTAPGGVGSYLGVGVGSGLTGRPVDVGIIDDPTKDQEEALSQTVKENQWNWYQSVFSTRLSEFSGQLIMATSWADDDLPSRIIKQYRGDARLKHLPFPAINLPGEIGYNPDLPEGALVPNLKSLEFLYEQKRLLSDYWWAAIYQQSPKALGGNVFKEFGVQYYLPKDLPAKFEKVIASWDCTFKDTDGTDYVVGQVWGKSGANSYLLAQVRARLSFSNTVAQVVSLKYQYPAIREILIEDKANGPAVIDVLKKQVAGIIPVEPDGSKLARAHAVTSYWEAHNVWLPHRDSAPWVVEFVNEVTRFPAAAHDDQVDAMTQALRRLYPLTGRMSISPAALAKAMGL